MNERNFSSFDIEMVQPALVRMEKELALRADYRFRAMTDHAVRAAKRADKELLERRASLPQNRTLGCEDRADIRAQLQDSIRAAKDALVLAESRLLMVERAVQEYARQDMRAGEQVIAYPGEASTAQPFLQDFFDNWDAEKSQARLLMRRWEDRPRAAGRGCILSRLRAALRGRW